MTTSATVKKKIKSGDSLSKVPQRKTIKHANDDIPVKKRARSLVIGETTAKRNPAVVEVEREREKKLKSKKKVLQPVVKTRREIASELVLPERIKKSNLPAVFKEPPQQRISKLNPKKMKSILGDAAEQINQLLESNSNESAQALLLKRLAQTTLDMIPFAENTIRKTKGQRGVYQFNSLITSIRELLIDMQSSRDKGALGDALIEKILRPVFMDIAMVLVKEDQIIGNVIKSVTSQDAAKSIENDRKASLVRISELIQKKYEEVKRDTISFLQQ